MRAIGLVAITHINSTPLPSAPDLLGESLPPPLSERLDRHLLEEHEDALRPSGSQAVPRRGPIDVRKSAPIDAAPSSLARGSDQFLSPVKRRPIRRAVVPHVVEVDELPRLGRDPRPEGGGAVPALVGTRPTSPRTSASRVATEEVDRRVLEDAPVLLVPGADVGLRVVHAAIQEPPRRSAQFAQSVVLAGVPPADAAARDGQGERRPPAPFGTAGVVGQVQDRGDVSEQLPVVGVDVQPVGEEDLVPSLRGVDVDVDDRRFVPDVARHGRLPVVPGAVRDLVDDVGDVSEESLGRRSRPPVGRIVVAAVEEAVEVIRQQGTSLPRRDRGRGRQEEERRAGERDHVRGRPGAEATFALALAPAVVVVPEPERRGGGRLVLGGVAGTERRRPEAADMRSGVRRGQG
ncbi:hypothetical protein ACHAWF_012814 [Thalassiosira exigua]